MSIYSRDYMRDPGSPLDRLRQPSRWSPIGWIIAISVAWFVVDYFFLRSQGLHLGFLSWETLKTGQVWRLFSHPFTHEVPFTALFSLLVLFFVGRLFGAFADSGLILRLFLTGALLGGLVQVLVSAVVPPLSAPIMGAGTGVAAMIGYLGRKVPFEQIRLLLFFVIPVTFKVRTLFLIVLCLNAVLAIWQLAGGPPSRGALGSLAALGIGFLMVKHPSLGLPAVRILRDEGSRLSSPKRKPAKKQKKPKPGSFVSQDIDSILDKINEEGFQSLTDEERAVLEKGSQKLSKRLDKGERNS